MEKISAGRKKYFEKLALWQASGLSCRKFCEREGVKYTWFIYHKKIVSKQNKSKGFDRIPLPVTLKNSTQSKIEFHYTDGRYLVFGPGTSLGLIKELIR